MSTEKAASSVGARAPHRPRFFRPNPLYHVRGQKVMQRSLTINTWAGLFKARLSLSRISANFYCNFDVFCLYFLQNNFNVD